MSTGGHSRTNSTERVPAEVGRDLVGLRMQILDNIKLWYSLKHPSKTFDFSIVTCSYKPNPGFPVLYSAMVVATIDDNGVKEIHSKHDVRTRDSYREDQSKTRMDALETLLADLEWRVNQCSNTYDTKLKRAPRRTAADAASVQLINGVAATYWQPEPESEEDGPVDGIYWQGGILYQNGNEVNQGGDDHDPADFVTPSVSSFSSGDISLSTARRIFTINDQDVDVIDYGSAASNPRRGPESPNFSNNFVGAEEEHQSAVNSLREGPQTQEPRHSPDSVEEEASSGDHSAASSSHYVYHTPNTIYGLDGAGDTPPRQRAAASSTRRERQTPNTTFGLDGAGDQAPGLPSAAPPRHHTFPVQAPATTEEAQQPRKYKKGGTAKKQSDRKTGQPNQPGQTAGGKQSSEAKDKLSRDPDETESMASDEDQGTDRSDSLLDEGKQPKKVPTGKKKGNPPQVHSYGTQHPHQEEEFEEQQGRVDPFPDLSGRKAYYGHDPRHDVADPFAVATAPSYRETMPSQGSERASGRQEAFPATGHNDTQEQQDEAIRAAEVLTSLATGVQATSAPQQPAPGPSTSAQQPSLSLEIPSSHVSHPMSPMVPGRTNMGARGRIPPLEITPSATVGPTAGPRRLNRRQRRTAAEARGLKLTGDKLLGDRYRQPGEAGDDEGEDVKEEDEEGEDADVEDEGAGAGVGVTVKEEEHDDDGQLPRSSWISDQRVQRGEGPGAPFVFGAAAPTPEGSSQQQHQQHQQQQQQSHFAFGRDLDESWWDERDNYVHFGEQVQYHVSAERETLNPAWINARKAAYEARKRREEEGGE
ncbi:MAG: hypothetical protein M1831_006752 [Alyxoria varia]|nr:MAG: hypothetical protein M1831_006752 [Alyxoria varia]